MIHLITGLPGSGKTLRVLQLVKALSEKDGRPVYYSGIPELTLPWLELDDVRRWMDLPALSIVVVDEAQRVFRPRASSAAVPDYVSALETHRHLGIDLYLITQHPTLIDANVRRLCGVHWHHMRKFGLEWSTVHEFAEVREHPDKGRRGSIEHQFKFPREVYSWFKSADAHTHKRRIPLRVWIALAVPLLVLAGGYFAFQGWYKLAYLTATDTSKGGSTVASKATAKGDSKGKDAYPLTPPASAVKTFVEARNPAISGLPHTAPMYSALTVPKSVPAPVMCVTNGDRCICYTDQATRIPGMSVELCRDIVASGFYVEWQDRDFARGGRAVTGRDASAPESAPLPVAGR